MKNKRKGGCESRHGFPLFISNEDMNDTITIIKPFDHSGVLIDGVTVKDETVKHETVKDEIIKQERGFLGACYHL